MKQINIVKLLLNIKNNAEKADISIFRCIGAIMMSEHESMLAPGEKGHSESGEKGQLPVG